MSIEGTSPPATDSGDLGGATGYGTSGGATVEVEIAGGELAIVGWSSPSGPPVIEAVSGPAPVTSLASTGSGGSGWFTGDGVYAVTQDVGAAWIVVAGAGS